MQRIIVVLTLLIFLAGCVAIKPNTMTDEQLNEAANADCQKGAVTAAIFGAFFIGIGAIPVYFAASHQCPINKELALKELEIRKLDLTNKERPLKREKLEAEIITNPQTVEPKREQMVRNVEEKGKSAPVTSAAKSTPQEKLSDKRQTVETPSSAIPAHMAPKPQAPQRIEVKQTSPVPSTTVQSTRQKDINAPVWNIGDTWKFQGEDKKSWDAQVIRVEGDLYIVRRSESGHLQAYDKKTLNLKCDIDKEGRITKIEDASVFMPTGGFIYFDFPLHLGKKWTRTITCKPMGSFVGKPTNHLERFECIAYENITTPLGTFETIKIKITLTDMQRMTSRVAHVWYSHELKSLIKISFEKMPPWSSEQQGYELISFNFKGNQTFKPEIKLQPQKADIPTNTQSPTPIAAQTPEPQVKLPSQKVDTFQKPGTPPPKKTSPPGLTAPTDEQPSGPQTRFSPQKADIPAKVQPPPLEKQQVLQPIAPSPSIKTQEVDNLSKSRPPVTDKRQVPGLGTSSTNPDVIAVTGTSANIRAGAGSEFPTVTTVKQGDKLILLGEYGQWLNVRLENGQEGWVNSRFVKE